MLADVWQMKIYLRITSAGIQLEATLLQKLVVKQLRPIVEQVFGIDLKIPTQFPSLQILSEFCFLLHVLLPLCFFDLVMGDEKVTHPGR